MSILLTVLLYSLFPVAAALFGALIAIYWPPKAIIRSYIQHLAGGVVFSVVAVELLPDIMHQKGAYWEVAIGFILGASCMLGLRTLSHSLETKNQGKNESKLSLLAGVALDVLLDGFLIGVSFSAGAKEGLLLTAALTLEMLSLGLAVSSSLGKVGRSPKRIMFTCLALFSTLILGAAIGGILMQTITPCMLEVVLSFGLAALMYLVTEELLVEAHKEPETPVATGMFFLGFLVFLLLGM